MLKCIAVDDEPLALQLMEDYIGKVPYLELAAVCNDAFEASAALQQQEIDLVFMDIQMPGFTGLQFIQSVPQRPMFILVTAYEKFALEGYGLDVVDYLLKPVDFSRFMQACNKAQALYQLKKGQSAPRDVDYFFVPADYSLVKLMYSDVMWIEGLRDYVKIHLKPPTHPMLVRSTVKAMENELPASRFLRIHKSFIVAVNSITSVRKNSVFIGDMELPIGETYRESIQQLTKRNIG